MKTSDGLEPDAGFVLLVVYLVDTLGLSTPSTTWDESLLRVVERVRSEMQILVQEKGGVPSIYRDNDVSHSYKLDDRADSE